MTVLAVLSCLLAASWLLIAVRFNRGWKSRKNPVSLAICAAILLFAYTNILFATALMGEVSWQFFAIATHVFDVIVVINFYVSFRWSDRKFEDQRHGTNYSVPPTNTINTPRDS